MSDIHQRYAEEIVALGGITSPPLRAALAQIHRERFLPPGPWTIESIEGMYYRSEDANRTHVLHAVGVAIDATRNLNNANPVKVCVQLERAQIAKGDTIFHVGAGFGYYSALMAALTGPTGKVIAAEIDATLRESAVANLTDWPNVSVIGDAFDCELPPCDVIFSSAGAGFPPLPWIDALKPGGRMILPITESHNHGGMFRFRKITADGPLEVSVHSFTRHYPCLGSRDEQALEALSEAFKRPLAGVSSLRRDPHPAGPDCWLHGDGFCLSYQQIDAIIPLTADRNRQSSA